MTHRRKLNDLPKMKLLPSKGNYFKIAEREIDYIEQKTSTEKRNTGNIIYNK